MMKKFFKLHSITESEIIHFIKDVDVAKIIKEEQAREATKIEQARNRGHENRIQNTGGWQSGMAADPGFMEGPAGSEAFSSRENLSDQMGSFNRGGLAGLWPR